MNINSYIDFVSIWSNEVCTDCPEDYEISFDSIQHLINFNNDDDVDLDSGECDFRGNTIVFVFSQNGGQNESDNVGWYRSYSIAVDSDYIIIDVDYEQG